VPEALKEGQYKKERFPTITVGGERCSDGEYYVKIYNLSVESFAQKLAKGSFLSKLEKWENPVGVNSEKEVSFDMGRNI